MAEGTVKAQLVAVLKAGADEQRVFIASLTDAQRAQVGTADKWSAKDILAHVVFFEKLQIQEIQMLMRGETPAKLPGDNRFDDRNQIIFDNTQNLKIFHEHRDQPWPEVIADAESAYAGLLALLDGYSEADLTTPDRLPRPRNHPLRRYFFENGYLHPAQHYADYYLEFGNLDRTIALQKQVAEWAASLGDERSRGAAEYNLACFYAKAGQLAPALALLPDALKRAPDLLEWSKQDPDLAPLHTEPAYRALYA